MNNEHDDKRPFSERIKDSSYKLQPEAAKLADHLRENEHMQRLAAATVPPPAKDLVLSQQQIEAIAEAVANRVVAKLRAEGDR
jgi:hypothetical protein